MPVAALLAEFVLASTFVLPGAQSPVDRGEVVVVSGDAQPYMEAAKALERRLKKDGYHTLRLSEATVQEWRPSPAAMPRAVAAVGSQAAATALSRAGNVQLAYCMVSDPKASGLEGQPRIVGVTSTVPLGPQFELICEALPTCRKVGMLFRSDSAASVQPHQVRAALPAPLTLHATDVAKCSSVSAAIDDLLAQAVDIVWAAPDSAVFDSATVRTLLLRGLRANVPLFGFSDSFVRAGALLGVSVDPETQGTQAAELLCAILDEKSPNPPPAEPQTPRFAIGVNLKVADHLKVKVPESVLAKAKYVVRDK